MHTQLVVLGGGPGGYAAAFMAADKGISTVLVEAEPRLGGTCLLRGCIPSKALLHVARVLSESEEMREWGIDFVRPAIDVDALRARKEKVISTLSAGLQQLCKQRKVTLVHGRGAFVNSRTIQLEGQAEPITYDHCILATGSLPARIPAFDLKTPRVMDSTGALELADVPKKLLVVGGGYIGLEMGTVYAALGSQVSVVELTSGLLPGADRDLVKPLHSRLQKVFHAIYLDTKVAKLTDRGEEIEVEFEGPEGKRTESYSRVLVSVGRKPNSQDIGLENTKVEVDKRGFALVDEHQRTSDPHILAIGDVAGEPMLAHKASHQGKVAVETILGEPAEFRPMGIPAVVFTDPEIAWTGLTEDQAKSQGRPIEVHRYPWAASGRALSIGRTDGLTKVIVDKETQRVIGVGIVGPNAGDLISEGTLALEMGASARDLAETIHPHPTLSETMGNAAEMVLGTATEIYRPRR